MKLSELTKSEVASYLKLDETEMTPGELLELDGYLNASKNFIKNYTGQEMLYLDEHPEINHVALVLCEDMHDNRSMYVDKNQLNSFVNMILGMHCINLL